MKHKRVTLAVLASGSAFVAAVAPAGAQSDPAGQPPAGSKPNPELIAGRGTAAGQPAPVRATIVPTPIPSASTTSKAAAPAAAAAAAACIGNGGFDAGENAVHCALGTTSLANVGAVRSQIPNDWARNDSPGIWTTTLRIDGNDWIQTDSGQNIDTIRLQDQVTASVFGVTGVSISGGGASASSGVTSTTAERDVTLHNTWLNQFTYRDSGQWKVVAPNFASSPCKVTRRAKGTLTHKSNSVFPEAAYSFYY